MASFIFIPGAWHGGWCWSLPAALLRQAGHVVSCPSLPGMDDVESAIEPTLATWAEFVADHVLRSKTRPFLVGHSRGGIVISETAERVPQAIKELVYLSAALLPNGAIPLDGLIKRMPVGTGSSDIPEWLSPPDYEIVRHTAFSDCSEEQARSAYSQLRREPTLPLKQPLRLTNKKFGAVPRTYIECLRDRAVSITDQRAMQQRLPCGRCEALDSDHSPFISAPESLAAVLMKLAANPLSSADWS